MITNVGTTVIGARTGRSAEVGSIVMAGLGVARRWIAVGARPGSTVGSVGGDASLRANRTKPEA
jgi:hypothetical protein